MHKTLYIDIDEEITSIVDRVKKAEVSEIIIVAPKNAMLLQSIVNLKLLKKEADRRKKQLLIITQDKIGKKLIEKAGILAQAKPGDDLFLSESSEEEKTYEPMYEKEASGIKDELQKEETREIGSSDYFEGISMVKEPPAQNSRKDNAVERKAKKKEHNEPPDSEQAKGDIHPENMEAFAALQKPDEEKNEKSKISMSDIVKGKTGAKPPKEKKKTVLEKKTEPEIKIKEEEPFADPYANINAAPPKMNQVSIKKAEKFFRGSRRKKKDFDTARVHGNPTKYFAIFGSIFVLFAALAAGYFLLPKATLALDVNNEEKTVSLDLTADGQTDSANLQNSTIPAELEQLSQNISVDFDATGASEGGAKATGKAVIYNEFSADDQPLVATTRLETSDGKIFRITKNVDVPGMSKVDGETKPGAIEVDVVADQPGDGNNIGPSDFKIPGFQNSPAKYEKFYAKSSEAMTGGSAGEAKEITADDIASAKANVGSRAKKQAIEALKNSLGQDKKIFDDVVQVEVSNVDISAKPGDQEQKFTVSADIKVSAISFRETDVKSLFRESLVNSGENPDEISFDKPINYILSDSNVQEKTLKFQAKTDAKIASDLDLENFKKGILGKTPEEAQSYAKNFSGIKNMEISLWPFFVNRIPSNEGKVKINVN
jgi:hypothetical protein